jgi:hypothetical protein
VPVENPNPQLETGRIFWSNGGAGGTFSPAPDSVGNIISNNVEFTAPALGGQSEIEITISATADDPWKHAGEKDVTVTETGVAANHGNKNDNHGEVRTFKIIVSALKPTTIDTAEDKTWLPANCTEWSTYLSGPPQYQYLTFGIRTYKMQVSGANAPGGTWNNTVVTEKVWLDNTSPYQPANACVGGAQFVVKGENTAYCKNLNQGGCGGNVAFTRPAADDCFWDTHVGHIPNSVALESAQAAEKVLRCFQQYSCGGDVLEVTSDMSNPKVQDGFIITRTYQWNALCNPLTIGNQVFNENVPTNKIETVKAGANVPAPP